MCDAEAARVLATQSGKQDDFNRAVDTNTRMIALLLPKIADAIRQAAAQPAEVCQWQPTRTFTDGSRNYTTGCGHLRGFMSNADCPYCNLPIKVKGE